MADETLDPEIFRKLNAGLDLTAAEQRKLARITGKTAKETQDLGDAARQAAKQLGGFYGQLIRTQQGSQFVAQQFTGLVSIVGSLGGALGKTKGLADLAGGKFGKVAGALGKLGVGVGEVGELIANMSDRLFDSFQSLSRVGAAGAEGMSGVFDQLQNFRLGLDELGQLTQLFGENAQSLVMFGGTVEQGAKSLGALRKFVTGSGLEKEFMGLGMNTQEINEAMAGFVARQTRLGMTQVTDYAKVATSLNAYIAEQDKITKLTGATRKQQEENQMRAMATEQFRAKIERLRAEKTAAGDAEAERLLGLQAMFYAADSSKQLGDAFTAVASGFITKGPGVSGQLVTQGALLEAANNRTIDQAKAAQMTKEGLDRFNQGVGNAQASVGNYQQAFNMGYSNMIDASKTLGAFATGEKTVTKAQEEQRKRADEGVKAQVDLRTATMNTMQNLQTLTNVAVPAVTQGLAALATAANSAAIALMTPLGQGGKAVGATSGYGQGGTGTQEGSLAATGAGALGGAVAGAPLGLPGIAGGATVGGLTGYAAYQAMGGASAEQRDPDKVIKFDPSGSGSRAHFDKLRPDVKEAALAMAYAYQRATGQRLNLNSAFRSAEEQAALAASGGQGRNPIAAPGQSLHQQGRALDFDPTQVDFLEKMGLLQQYGFKRLQGDPPHIYMQDGGIATGPQSGYQATLHGTEAVVPLPDGKTIPVTMPEMSNQMNMMSEQITRLDELIALMRNANGISHKILQASTN